MPPKQALLLGGESHSRRGRWWEEFLTPLHASYQHRRVGHIWRNYPEIRRVGDGEGGEFRARYTGKGRPDFSGVVDGVGFHAEAKESGESRWLFEDLRPEQALDFDAILCAGGDAFLFLRDAKGHRAHIVPWLRVREAWLRWRVRWEHQERSPPGEASLTWIEIADLSIYSEVTASGRWDYLPALRRWWAESANWRAERRTDLLSVPPPALSLKTRRGDR